MDPTEFTLIRPETREEKAARLRAELGTVAVEGQQIRNRLREEFPEKTMAGGVLTQAGIGITRGMADLSQGVNKGLEFVIRNLPLSVSGNFRMPEVLTAPIADKFRENAAISGRASKEVELLGRQTEGPDLVRQVAAGVMSTVPSLAAAPAGLPAAAAAAGAQSFASTLAQAEDSAIAQGATPAEARAKAVVPAIASGLVTGFVTKGFGKTGIEAWPDLIRKGTWKETGKSILREMGMEATEEWWDQVGQSVIGKLSYDPQMTFGQALQESAQAGIAGGLAAGALHVVNMVGRPPEQPTVATPPPAPNPEDFVKIEQPSTTAGPGVYLVYDQAGRELRFGPLDPGVDVASKRLELERAWPDAEFQSAVTVAAGDPVAAPPAGPVAEPTSQLMPDQQEAVDRLSGWVQSEAPEAGFGVYYDASETIDGRGVEAKYSGGKLMLNAAFLTDDARARAAMREEMAHADLASTEGQVALDMFLDSHPLSEQQRRELEASGYVPQDGETQDDYRRRLTDEWIAKQARDRRPWWRDLVDRFVAWSKQKLGVKLTQDQAAREILRRLRQRTAESTVGGNRHSLSADDLRERLYSELDSFAPARESGRVDYSLNDVADRFVDFTDGKSDSLLQMFKDFAAQDPASKTQLSKLKSAVQAASEDRQSLAVMKGKAISPVAQDFNVALENYAAKATGYMPKHGVTHAFDRAFRSGTGRKLWEDMTPAERLAEFRSGFNRDWEVARTEASGRPVDYLLDRALDPLDPYASVYQALLKRLGAQVQNGMIRLSPALKIAHQKEMARLKMQEAAPSPGGLTSPSQLDGGGSQRSAPPTVHNLAQSDASVKTQFPEGATDRHSLTPAKVAYYEQNIGAWSAEEKAVIGGLQALSRMTDTFSRWRGKGSRPLSKWNEFLSAHPQAVSELRAIQDSLPGRLDWITPDGKLRPIAIEAEADADGKQRYHSFHRGIAQLFLDRLPVDLYLGIQRKLTQAVEHAYAASRRPGFGGMLGSPVTFAGVQFGKPIAAVEGESQEYRVQTPIRLAKKTVAVINLNSACPMFTIGNRGCWGDGCYLTQMAKANGTNLFERAMYTGEVLQLADSDITALNRMGGLRVNGVGDTTPDNVSQLKDVIRHAAARGLKLKVITKQATTFAAIEEHAKSGGSVDHVTVQPSIDYYWRPVQADLETEAGMRELSSAMGGMVERGIATGNQRLIQMAYDSFGREVRQIDGVWHRKDGFSWKQVEDLRAKFPAVRIIPRVVVGSVEEVMDTVINHPDAVITLMHGALGTGVVSELPGQQYNYDASRHAFRWDPSTARVIVTAETSSPAAYGQRRPEYATKGHKALEQEINTKYSKWQRFNIWRGLKRQTCCQENDSPDACADCASHCALIGVMSRDQVDAAYPLRKPESTDSPEKRMGVDRYSLEEPPPPDDRQSILSGEAQAAVNRIEATSHDQRPDVLPVYDPGIKDNILRKLGRKSQRILYFGGKELLKAKLGIELAEAYRAKAVRTQSEALLQQLQESAWKGGPKGWRLPRWMQTGAWARRLRKFHRLALPIAAHLHVTGRDVAGQFEFADFEMRAGFMTTHQFAKGKHQVGDTILMNNPLTDEEQEIRIGPLVSTPDGRVGYQLLRPMSATQQAEIYQHYAAEYPDMMWLVDMFVDPDLKKARLTFDGVDVPVFNRFALATMMGEDDPNFRPVDGYTPDVIASRSLLGAISSIATSRLRAGGTSPGRRYKSGKSREEGNVRDLVQAFSVRSFQLLAEKGRKEYFKAVLAAAVPIRNGIVPEGYQKLELGMDAVWQAVKRLRHWESPKVYRPLKVDEDPDELRDAGKEVLERNGKWYEVSKLFPAVEARMSEKGYVADLDPDDQTLEYKRFFGEAYRMRGRQLMLPNALVDSLIKSYAAAKEHGRLYKIGAWMIRNSVQLFLAHPKTYLANVLTNDLFTMEAVYRHAISGIAGRRAFDLRFASKMLGGMLVNRFKGLRELVHIADKTRYLEATRTILPDEVFAGSTGLTDVMARYDTNAVEALKSGEIGAAALALIQYGTIDVRGKQRIAYAWLRANAVTRAKQAGLRGKAMRQAVDQYMQSPPVEDRTQAVAAANFELLNYADSPDWLQSFSRSAYGRLVVPFPRFGYHFLAKQALRLKGLRLLIGRVPKGQRADALADLITVGTFGLGGAGLLADSVLRALLDLEDDDPRKYVGTSQVREMDDDGQMRLRPIDRDLITSNRVNISYWARALGLDTDNEDDFWIRVRQYPAISAAGAAVLALADAKRFGAAQGAATYISTMSDLAGDFFSVGMAVKVPAKIMAEIQSLGTGRAEKPAFDPYATNVPLTAYLTEQALDSFVPGSRQADELIWWLDPTARRRTASKQLGYQPGIWQAMEANHWTGLLDRVYHGGESPLPPAGEISRYGFVAQPRDIPLTERISSLGGVNIRPINRDRYERAIQ